MRKYWTVFKISWQREFEYRFNFFMGRLRSVVVLLLLYYLWKSLTDSGKMLAGYSQDELITYVFMANILRAIIFGAQSRLTATEINDGTFSIYIIKPVNHFCYVFFRELAQRFIVFFSALIEISVFALIAKPQIVWQTDYNLLILFFVASFFALVLYFILSYLVSSFAFWSREAMGPRFLFEWILELSSGAYYPINILSTSLFLFMSFLPFFYLIYFPVRIYLGKENISFIFLEMGIQIFWISISGLISFWIWRKGVKKFSGEGI